MIIYYSATGNNKYLAQQIAQENEEIISIVKCMKEDIMDINVPEGESLGIILPTYFGGLASIVEEFLSKVNIHINENSYVYCVASYGTTTGYLFGYVNRYLINKNIKLNAQFEIKMPDTWTAIFDLTDKNKVKQQTSHVDEQLKTIIPKILNKTETKTGKNLLFLIAAIFSRKMYDNGRKTEHLHVLDSCISCNLCSNNCPINAIEIKDNKPVWVKDKCVMCLRCLHRCPTFSIQYDNKTENHGQYTNPHITEFD